MKVNAVGNDYTGVYAEQTKVSSVKEEASEAKASEGVVYEKSSENTKKATYSINKMSAEDRENLVKQIKADQQAQEQNFLNIVSKVFTGQSKTFAIAMDSDKMWKTLASGNFTVDAATKAQAQQDISEDGYWGVNKTAQRLFDFASALAGDDEEQMKKMQEAMQKGFKQAMGVWGKDLPEISGNTLDKANKLFEDYYNSKQVVTE